MPDDGFSRFMRVANKNELLLFLKDHELKAEKEISKNGINRFSD